jgi:hypothetical protein
MDPQRDFLLQAIRHLLGSSLKLRLNYLAAGMGVRTVFLSEDCSFQNQTGLSETEQRSFKKFI